VASGTWGYALEGKRMKVYLSKEIRGNPLPYKEGGGGGSGSWTEKSNNNYRKIIYRCKKKKEKTKNKFTMIFQPNRAIQNRNRHCLQGYSITMFVKDQRLN